jgi:hypothetical protein
MHVLNLSIGGPDFKDQPFVEKVTWGQCCKKCFIFLHLFHSTTTTIASQITALHCTYTVIEVQRPFSKTSNKTTTVCLKHYVEKVALTRDGQMDP